MLKPLSSKAWAAKYFPVLKIAGDPLLKAPVALNKSVCVVGRRLGVHLPLNSKQVSKVHALIVRQREGVYIRDLASRNHVYVNGLAVRETELDTGDSVRVGPYTLHCQSGFSPSEAIGPQRIVPAVRTAPDAALQVVGENAPRALEGRALLIGQRDDCDLTLDDQRVSPVHAVIFELDGKHILRDLNSGAGAFVNNQSVHQQELEPGDEIRIGRARIRYEVLNAPSAAPIVESPTVEESDNDLISLDSDEEMEVDPVAESGDAIPLVRQTLDDSRAPEPAHPQPPGAGVERAWMKETPPPSPGAADPAAQKLDQIVTDLSEKVAELESTWKEVKDDVQHARDDERESAS